MVLKPCKYWDSQLPTSPRAFPPDFWLPSTVAQPFVSFLRIFSSTPWKFNSSPLKNYHPKKESSLKNHPFFRGYVCKTSGGVQFQCHQHPLGLPTSHAVLKDYRRGIGTHQIHLFFYGQIRRSLKSRGWMGCLEDHPN